ncbi:MAG: serine hydrolase domain-containing protein [Balneolaceae bacterium]
MQSINLSLRRFTPLLLFLILSSQALYAQSGTALTETSPENAGVSSERIGKIDAMLQESVENGDIPGVVALIARNGNIVFHKAFGMADNESGRALKKDDIFRIASQSKAITATAVMILWEEGEFRLDDPVSRYIPEFADPQVLESFDPADSSYTTIPADREITIRHLLTHTSGIGYGMIDSDERVRKIYQKAGIVDLFTTEPVSIGENIRLLAGLPLHHHPGDAYVYSEGLDVLGYFIEVVSGLPFDQFLKERVFDPLGMEDTRFYQPEEKAARLVPVQHKEDGEWARYPVTFYDPDYPIKGAKTFFSGGAGLTSTARDYATFLQMYLNGGELNGNRILSPTTIRTIMGNQTGDLFGQPDEYYGLAFGVLTEQGQNRGGLGSPGTFDWGGYFNTQYFADPEQGVIGVLLKQTQGPTTDQTSWKFRQMTGASVTGER